MEASAERQSTSRRLQIIEKQIDNIVRTVKQLLSWSRKFELKIEPVDLRRVVEEATLLSSPAVQLRKIKVKLDLAKDCPKIYGDAGYLRQVFLNLINNSMDAMPRGGELRIEMRMVKGDAREVAVHVADNGVGMSPETMAHVFDPMFTTKRMGTGTGLALQFVTRLSASTSARFTWKANWERELPLRWFCPSIAARRQR